MPPSTVVLCVCVREFTWPPVRAVCPNYEVVVFQPLTVTPPHLGSVTHTHRTTVEGGIGQHLPRGQYRPIPHWVPDDPEEALLLRSIRSTPHPLTITGNEVTV